LRVDGYLLRNWGLRGAAHVALLTIARAAC
jgi:hypothetical protein